MIARGWIEKKRLFEKQVESMGMEELDFLEREDEQVCPARTYSGSLLNIGPAMAEGRNVQYASIGLRQDEPETAARENSEPASDVKKSENRYPYPWDPSRVPRRSLKLRSLPAILTQRSRKSRLPKLP